MVRIAPDACWPGMWRILMPDGTQSDMANLARIKDAAAAICERGPARRDRRRFRWHIENRISTTGLARKCNARLDGHPRPTTCSGTIPHADYKASRAFPNLMSTETQNVFQKEF
jgi:hypothetical protein